MHLAIFSYLAVRKVSTKRFVQPVADVDIKRIDIKKRSNQKKVGQNIFFVYFNL